MENNRSSQNDMLNARLSSLEFKDNSTLLDYNGILSNDSKKQIQKNLDKLSSAAVYKKQKTKLMAVRAFGDRTNKVSSSTAWQAENSITPSNGIAQHDDDKSKTDEEEDALASALYKKPQRTRLPPLASTATTAMVASSAIGMSPALPVTHAAHAPEQPKDISSFDENKGKENLSYEAEGEEEAKKLRKLSQKEAQHAKGEQKQFYKRPNSTLFFKDTVRRIDFVIAYEDTDEDRTQNRDIRERYEAGLLQAGLELEWEPKEESQDGNTYFLKIHVPWKALIKYAERMRMRMPIKEDKHVEIEEEETVVEKGYHQLQKIGSFICLPFKLQDKEGHVLNETPHYYTAEFSRDKMKFFEIKDETTFFSNSERSRIAHRILSETRFGSEDSDKLDLGIQKLISIGVYNSAFPLHEGRQAGTDKKLPTNHNSRRRLYWDWARWGRWYKYQPLHLIRNYFGEKIGMYFAFLGFYSMMLLNASIVGLIVLLYGIITLYTETNNFSNEVCDETFVTYAGNSTMCPLCDVDCSFWKLRTSCLAARITHLFDNEATIFFAVFMSLWATMFLEFWKRRQFRLAYEWDLVDYDEERDLIRPEFEAQVKNMSYNPITQRKEPYLKAKQRLSRTAFSLITVLFWIFVIIAAVIAIIVYRLAITAVFALLIDFSQYQDVSFVGQFLTPQMLTTITASLLSLIVIMILNKLYEKVALWLTEMELPRTQLQFEDSFTFKMFCFQFVNYYSYLFYIAFFKQTIAGYPGDYTYFAGEWRWNSCDSGGCMYELSIQLFIIMFGKQLWNNCVELVVPWIMNKWRRWHRTEQPNNVYTRWEQDYDLMEVTNLSLFYEYLEMVIQFGFVTLFVAAFPLAPLLALLNNIIEIRLDANKFICELRRPLSQKCADIGAWYYLLEFIGALSVVTNAFTIALTSEAIPKMVYYYVYSQTEYGGNYTTNTQQGFTENSLSFFNVSDFSQRSMPSNLDPFNDGVNITICRYRDYRTPPWETPKYQLTMQYWHVVAGRLAFIIAMEHVVFLSKSLIDYLIPDRPRKLRRDIKREHFLVKEMLVKAETEMLVQKAVEEKEEELAESTRRKKSPEPVMSSSFVEDDYITKAV